MLARTVCETALARAKFVRNSKIFPFFCDSRANFAHQQAKKSFSKKLILNISAVFMADDEASSFHWKYALRFCSTSHNKSDCTYEILVILLNHGL